MEEFGGTTHYEVLGVRADASADDIRRAYRTMAKTAHPDAGGEDGTFRRILEAYETLSSPLQRRDYDARLGLHDRHVAASSGAGAAGTGSVRPTRVDERGWTGPQGAFTGDVEFPAWLRDVTEAPWQSTTPREPAGPPPVRKALVQWWSPIRAAVTPVPAGPLLLVGTADAVVALDALAGQEVWRAGLASAPAAPPVLSGDTVVVWTTDGVLHGLEIGRGVTRWQHRFGAPSPGGLVRVGPAEVRSPVLTARADARLVSIDPATGAAGWSTRLRAAPTAAMTLVDGLAVVACGTSVEAVEVRKGRPRWRVGTIVAVTVPPVVLGDSVWVSGGRGTLHRVAASTGAAAGTWEAGAALGGVSTDGRQLYVTAAAPSQLVALDGAGAVRWAVSTVEVCPEPAVVDGQALLAVPNGRLVAVRALTGHVEGEVELPFPPSGPPMAVLDRIVLRERDGKLWAVAAPGG
jgi:outer membrane protein assembly factor BamB